MMMEHMRTLFGYNAWANARILAAAARVPSKIFITAALGPCNLHNTLRHILKAEVLLRSGWLDVEDAAATLPGVFPTVEALRTRWRDEDEHLMAFLATLRDEDLRRSMASPPDPPETLGEQLQHLVNHGTQHRSEAALLLTDWGQSPGWMDFLIYTRETRTP